MGRRPSRGAFLKLPPQEQERILDACLDEFANQGYAQASTNAIVKRVGIPKGSIFYWFGTKDDLYLHLVGRATERFVSVIDRKVSGWPDEILARLRIITQASIEFLEMEPRLYRLLMAFVDGGARHLLDRFLRSGLPDGLKIWADWFGGVDTTGFRATPEATRELLMWVVAGIKFELLAGLGREAPPSDLPTLVLERLDRLIPILAHAIYRRPAERGYE